MMSLSHDRGALAVGGAASLAATLIVAFALLDHQSPSRRIGRGTPPNDTDGSSARSYTELRDHRRGPNAHLYEPDLYMLVGTTDELPSFATDAERQASHMQRSRRRAYDGAPPTVPHAVSQQTADCAGCHLEGLTIAGKRAPKPSHPPMPSCAQCHVPAEDPRPDSAIREQSTPPSTFRGLLAAERGTRAWVGAPPTIPHAVQNRSECDSCHGPAGAAGLRTPHPFRVSCTQCHVSSRERDQRPAQGMSERGGL